MRGEGQDEEQTAQQETAGLLGCLALPLLMGGCVGAVWLVHWLSGPLPPDPRLASEIAVGRLILLCLTGLAALVVASAVGVAFALAARAAWWRAFGLGMVIAAGLAVLLGLMTCGAIGVF